MEGHFQPLGARTPLLSISVGHLRQSESLGLVKEIELNENTVFFVKPFIHREVRMLEDTAVLTPCELRKDADIIVFDDNINVESIFVLGEKRK